MTASQKRFAVAVAVFVLWAVFLIYAQEPFRSAVLGGIAGWQVGSWLNKYWLSTHFFEPPKETYTTNVELRGNEPGWLVRVTRDSTGHNSFNYVLQANPEQDDDIYRVINPFSVSDTEGRVIHTFDAAVEVARQQVVAAMEAKNEAQ